jgi:hypothetical protein
MVNQKGNLTIILAAILVVIILSTPLIFSKLTGRPLFSKLTIGDEMGVVDFGDPKTFNNKTVQPSPVVDNTIKFDVEKAHVGDKVGDMEIVKLRGYKSDTATNDSAFVDFKGKTTVTGDIMYNLPGGQMGELVCMQNLDAESQAKMPKLSSQSYVTVSFCFDDLENAKKLLVKDVNIENQGVKTVVIDDFKIQWFPIEIYNTAKLISLIK